MHQKKYDQLTDAFYRDLEFGTGGLIGIMGAGSNRINQYTLGMATQGLSNYLKNVYSDEQIKVLLHTTTETMQKNLHGLQPMFFQPTGSKFIFSTV